jgi:hypothetical protein
MKNLFCLFALCIFIGCTSDHSGKTKNMSVDTEKAIDLLVQKEPSLKESITKGVMQVARLWQESDGTNEDFIRFCENNYIFDPIEKENTFLKISEYLEAVFGHYNELQLQLQKNLHEETGPLTKVDELFSAYNPDAHLSDDSYSNKTAFLIALNFPKLSLKEKEALDSSNRLTWAYARLGDIYTFRIPAEIQQAISTTDSDANTYVGNYNIYAGYLLNKKGEKLFPEDMVLLSHWNLRDEIKANYNQGDVGLDKQETIYEVMKRIISQEIPQGVINSN